MSQNIAVITVDGAFSDFDLPLLRQRLEEVKRGSSGFTATEERKVLSWINGIHYHDKPLGDDRIEELMEDDAKRTMASEDHAIAEWVLKIWTMLEKAL